MRTTVLEERVREGTASLVSCSSLMAITNLLCVKFVQSLNSTLPKPQSRSRVPPLPFSVFLITLPIRTSDTVNTSEPFDKLLLTTSSLSETSLLCKQLLRLATQRSVTQRVPTSHCQLHLLKTLSLRKLPHFTFSSAQLSFFIVTNHSSSVNNLLFLCTIEISFNHKVTENIFFYCISI